MAFSVGIGLTNECDLGCGHCYRLEPSPGVTTGVSASPQNRCAVSSTTLLDVC
jgi:hypothetical protein